jgi:uncharacterized protein
MSMDILIGRRIEKSILQKALDSQEAELIALYGRRRVGKTFLIRQSFEQKTVFCEITGLKDGSMKDQLAIFSRSFQKTFPQEVPLPPLPSWRYAFELLTVSLKKVSRRRKTVIFFDEISWLATPKSGLIQQFDHFWNTEWCKLTHVKVVLCGSAASWILEKLVHAKGGLHNRLTRTIPLKPFSLGETKAYLESRKIKMALKQILELTMVLGGVPYYLKQIERGLSATQNINRICFRKEGLLYDEFDRLFSSLFNHAGQHMKIIQVMARHRQGISRNELIEKTGIPSGSGLNRYLHELEEAGFIARFIPYQLSQKNSYYRLIDEYSLFYLKWIKKAPKGVFSDSDPHYWEKLSGTASWKSWAGYAFEGICMKHARLVKKALQIENIPTETAAWRYIPRKDSKEAGAQIDLLFDRGDGIISICEIKYSEDKFSISKAYARNLENKIKVFQEQTKGRKKHLFLTMITTFGVQSNAYSEALLSQEVLLEDLFEV